MTPIQLDEIPTAIFVQTGDQERFHIYRGTPDEMVRHMAQEIEAESSAQAIDRILLELALHHRIVIHLPKGLDDEKRSALFVLALLNMKIAYPLAQA